MVTREVRIPNPPKMKLIANVNPSQAGNAIMFCQMLNANSDT